MRSGSIEFISASAGSGKTHSLTAELAEAVGKGVRPEGVLATTFTNKAASELMERVRFELLKKGHWEQAQLIFDGYVGTVNSVCGRLLKDFAFEAGLSPVLDVIPEGEDQAVYEQSIAGIVERYTQQIEPISQRLAVEDWRSAVKDIIKSARSNNIAPEDLKENARWSWESFKALLPDARHEKEEGALDQELGKVVEMAVKELLKTDDSTKKTSKVLDQLQRFIRRQREISSLPWAEWVRLTKLDTGAKSRNIVSTVINAARVHPQHPRFHCDVKVFISKIFEVAAEAMKAFADFKTRYGLIDFVDQESLCLRLLDQSDVRKRLKERLDLVLVDEFQDTSPIQLALFLRLAEIAPRSVWVGDQKQAIYGFRGTDPALMDAVMEGLIKQKHFRILPDSYRSRPELVRFTSYLFAKAFETVGIEPREVTLNAKRRDLPGHGVPLHMWWLSAKNLDNEAQALAVAVEDFLSKATEFQVLDETSGRLRPLKGGNIAILCRTNDRCLQIADALEGHGVRATIPRKGLLSQAECVLALACLRYLVDQSDSLAAAEIVHFTEDPPEGRWFSEWLESNEDRPWSTKPIIRDLDARRDELIYLTPSEALELALSTTAIDQTILQWGDGAQRVANIDTLRVLAKSYEDRCQVQRSAGTPAGLVTFLSEGVTGGDLDMQAEGRDEKAVQVLTYHRSKGLEWPVVILCDLHSSERAGSFGVHVSAPKKDFDPRDPLKDRWIRYWPWPYDKYKTGTGLESAINDSHEQNEALLQERKEMMRLLYVGMTRARDYLVLAAREAGRNSTAWLDTLKDKTGTMLLSLPVEVEESVVKIGGDSFQMKPSRHEPGERERSRETEQTYISAIISEKRDYPPARLVPSHVESSLTGTVEISSTVRLGGRLSLTGEPDMQILGEAVHAFLAADDVTQPRKQRLDMAGMIMENWSALWLKAEDLLFASDRLRGFVDKIYGRETIRHREWPIHLRIGDQKASGWIDLLLETPRGYVIIDHKSFPGRMEQWSEQALRYAPQLDLYQKAVEKATARHVIATMIHMPVLGVIMEVKIGDVMD